MLKDLIKLADFLDQNQKKQMADAVDQMVENLVRDPNQDKRFDPTSAPKRHRLDVDTSSEWDSSDYLEPDDLPTEIMEPSEMVQQHKASKELVGAMHKILNQWQQHPISIKWHVPGTEPGINTNEQEGEQPYWIVVARSDDPTDVPDDNYWAMWEVNPGDPNWESATPIEGKQTRLYGEW